MPQKAKPTQTVPCPVIFTVSQGRIDQFLALWSKATQFLSGLFTPQLKLQISTRKVNYEDPEESYLPQIRNLLRFRV